MERLERLGFLFASARQYLNISYEKIQELSPNINIESVKAWEQGDNKQISFWEIQELLDLVGLDIEFGFNLDKSEKDITNKIQKDLGIQKDLNNVLIDNIWINQILPKITDETTEITTFIVFVNNRLDELKNFIDSRTKYNVVELELHTKSRIDGGYDIYKLMIRLK